MEYIEVHVCQKYGLYRKPCLRLNPLLLVCHKKQNKKAKVGTKSNWCSKLYQSYGLNLPLHGAEGVAPLFLLTQKFTGSLLKSERLSCLKSFGRILFCDCRTNRVRLSAQNCSQKKRAICSLNIQHHQSHIIRQCRFLRKHNINNHLPTHINGLLQ